MKAERPEPVELHALYAKLKSRRAVAWQLNVSVGTIGVWLKEAGVKMEPPGRAAWKRRPM